ncbi:histidine kinase [Pseudoduganella sp. LjRoot289]|uniref:sensor histidine kinase n=1 Tax=Pseudoduganella sp. LjRoot289 TaxID=3342314 RepID=UPI003ED02338
MWNRLANWYRDWEEEQIRVLERPELAETVAPGYRRYCAVKMAELSFIERQQLRDFTLKYRGWRVYAAVGRLLLLFTLAGLAACVVFPNLGVLRCVAVANAIGIVLMVSSFGVWFNYRRLAGNSMRIGLKLVGWSVFAALVVVWTGARRHGDSLQQALATNGPTELAVCLGVAALVAVPFALVGLVRNRQFETLTAKLALDGERERAARELSESQLRLLRAQIEPHFLFNTLGAVQQLAEQGAPQAAALTANLIDFLRASWAGMRSERATLRADFEIVDAYLKVMQTRMGPRLRYSLELPEELIGTSVPGMMLLTLVENAIKHGIEPSLRGGAIDVSARRVDGMVRIRVRDSGVGMSAVPGAGAGLDNIRKRLQLSYGGAASLVLNDGDEGGVVADIVLPAGKDA